jgi:hypothetical protein
MAMADAEGLNAPEGNTSATDLARWCRSAGVLRPWHAGREMAKTLASPRRSCLWPTLEDGRQLLRHRRGNPATEQGWHRRSTVDQGTGTRRSPDTGKARRIRMGGRRTQSTQRWGQPTPGGRTWRKSAARTGTLGRTRSDRTPMRQPPCGGEPTKHGQTSKRVCLKALLCTADASTTEAPDAGQLHVRVCTGGAG